MKKENLIIIILLIIIAGLLFVSYSTAECIVNRAQVGMTVDWNQIKDCAY